MGSPGRSAAVVLLGLGLGAAGCNKVPAEEALAEAERTLEEARAHIEQFAPETLGPLNRSLEEARTALAEGRHTDALRRAQELLSRIHRAVEAADRRNLAATLASSSAPPGDAPAPSLPDE